MQKYELSMRIGCRAKHLINVPGIKTGALHRGTPHSSVYEGKGPYRVNAVKWPESQDGEIIITIIKKDLYSAALK
jgi:hypothetical protein